MLWSIIQRKKSLTVFKIYQKSRGGGGWDLFAQIRLVGYLRYYFWLNVLDKYKHTSHKHLIKYVLKIMFILRTAL